MKVISLLKQTSLTILGSMSEYEELPTQTLVHAASSGNTEALNTLCQRLLPRLKLWIHGQLPPHARDLCDTEDLVVETLWNSVQKLPGLDLQREGSFLKYLRTALRNRLYNETRRHKARPGHTELEETTVDADHTLGPRTRSPEEEAELRQAMGEYEQALDHLSPTEQDLVIARLEFGMSFIQIAEWFDKPSENAARMAVNRAAKKLATIMSASA